MTSPFILTPEQKRRFWILFESFQDGIMLRMISEGNYYRSGNVKKMVWDDFSSHVNQMLDLSYNALLYRTYVRRFVAHKRYQREAALAVI